MNVLKFKSFDETSESNDQSTKISKFQARSTSQSVENSSYLQDYLKTVISRLVKVDFFLGNESLISKEGILKEVGTDYIVLERLQTNDLLVCDLYSIKFVEII